MIHFHLPTAILWWNIMVKVTGHQKLEADVTLKLWRIFTSCAPEESRLINAHCRTVCLIEIHNLYYLDLWKNGERSHLTLSYQDNASMMPFSKCDVFYVERSGAEFPHFALSVLQNYATNFLGITSFSTRR